MQLFLREDKVQSFKLNVILLGRSTTISRSIPLNWVLHLEDRYLIARSNIIYAAITP